MLAVPGRIRGHEDHFAFEPKWDGWRALVTLAVGALEVRTRTGRPVWDTVPELAGLLDGVARPSVVLDGELVAHSGSPSSFYRLGRDGGPALRSAVPLTFVAFDVLWLDGDVTGCPYEHRRGLLEELELAGPAWCTSPSYLGIGAKLFAACAALGLEGLVAERLDGRYHAGVRSDVWVKAKCSAWVAQHARHRHRPGR